MYDSYDPEGSLGQSNEMDVSDEEVIVASWLPIHTLGGKLGSGLKLVPVTVSAAPGTTFTLPVMFFVSSSAEVNCSLH